MYSGFLIHKIFHCLFTSKCSFSIQFLLIGSLSMTLFILETDFFFYKIIKIDATKNNLFFVIKGWIDLPIFFSPSKLIGFSRRV